MSKKPKLGARKIVLRDYKAGGTVTIAGGEERKTPESMQYIPVIRQLLQTPKNPRTGATTQETRDVYPVLDQLDEASVGDALYLTESQWADLKERIANYPGQMNQRSFVVFEDDIKAAPVVDMCELDQDSEETDGGE